MTGTGPLDGQGDATHVGRWHPEPDGAVAADAVRLRLVVRSLTPGGYAHHLVPRRPGGGRRGALPASGSEEGVPAAMRAAERAAARAACVPAGLRP